MCGANLLVQLMKPPAQMVASQMMSAVIPDASLLIELSAKEPGNAVQDDPST